MEEVAIRKVPKIGTRTIYWCGWHQELNLSLGWLLTVAMS